MTDKKISQLNSLTKSTIATGDVFPVVDTSASETKKITYQELIQPQDDHFRVSGSSDSTKKVAFDVDNLTIATTRTITIPDADTTLVGTDVTQTLSNKTLTAPQINMGSDANGDIYYRNGSGVTSRLAIGTAGQILDVSASGLPEWIDNPAAMNASVTDRGIVELATLAETLSRTTTGGTGAKLVVTPDNLTTVLTYDYAVDSSGTDTYSITVTPAPTAYVTGQKFTFKVGTSNIGTCSLNVNGLGSKTIYKNYNATLADGDLLAGQVVTVAYDGTNFQLQSPVANSMSGKYTNGDTTKNAADASTTQTIAHGCGTTPKKVRIRCISQSAATAGLLVTAETVYNGTTQSSQSSYANGGGTYTQDNTFSLNAANAASTFTRGVVTVDATNINIAWTKTGSPTGTFQILWEAEA